MMELMLTTNCFSMNTLLICLINVRGWVPLDINLSGNIGCSTYDHCDCTHSRSAYSCTNSSQFVYLLWTAHLNFWLSVTFWSRMKPKAGNHHFRCTVSMLGRSMCVAVIFSILCNFSQKSFINFSYIIDCNIFFKFASHWMLKVKVLAQVCVASWLCMHCWYTNGSQSQKRKFSNGHIRNYCQKYIITCYNHQVRWKSRFDLISGHIGRH